LEDHVEGADAEHDRAAVAGVPRPDREGSGEGGGESGRILDRTCEFGAFGG
jgi:hypothetical protein